MNHVAKSLRGAVHRVLAVQAVLIGICALAFWLGAGGGAGLAAVYGGMVSVLMTLVLAWRVSQAGRVTAAGKISGVFPAYLGVVERFALAIAGLAVGMGLLHLMPAPMLVSFAAAQLSFVIASMQRQQG